MSNRSVVFAGTPAFAVPTLEALLRADVRVPLVLTQPDRPAGRGRRLSASPVKSAALDAGIRVEQPISLRDAAIIGQLEAYEIDLLVVVAYGLILPRPALEWPSLGAVNVHA